jgi:hypothetical protein
MRSPQLLIYEPDDRLLGLLREQAKEHKWTWREVRSPESCLRLLRHGGPNMVVLKVGNDVTAEMRFLEQCGRLYPDTALVVVSDMDNPWLTGLAWDLGARYVLSPPQPRNQLPDIVAGLMAAIGPPSPGSGEFPPPEGAEPPPPSSSKP